MGCETGLPTEQEWEWSARGGLVGKIYPWGDQESDSNQAKYAEKILKLGKTAAVGSYPANGYGLYDMAGNVSEWCRDWFYNSRVSKVVREGSWHGINRKKFAIVGLNISPPPTRPYPIVFRCLTKLSKFPLTLTRTGLYKRRRVFDSALIWWRPSIIWNSNSNPDFCQRSNLKVGATNWQTAASKTSVFLAQVA